MKSIKELYRIGTGPSSSHTMGPRWAAEQFTAKHPEATKYTVTLYGSLAATGKGHMTDVALEDVLGRDGKEGEILWEPATFLKQHPNGLRFTATMPDGKQTEPWTVFSIGGGAVVEEGATEMNTPEIYDLNTMTQIMDYCDRTGRCYWEYVEKCEGPEIWDYLRQVWKAMRESVERGLAHEGRLPGPLNLRRKAASYLVKAEGFKDNLRSRGLTFAYALAVSEENASGGVIVTAPTCGSSGVVPGALYHLWKSRGFEEVKMLRALATAGLIGNIVKHNASISGAEVGCQGEVGVACAMAAAAACQLFGGSPVQIEYAA